MWKNGVTDGWPWEAKVYDNPSMWGINDGRVSKLTIYDPKDKTGNTTIYHYDRGLDHDDTPKGLLDKVLADACA